MNRIMNAKRKCRIQAVESESDIGFTDCQRIMFCMECNRKRCRKSKIRKFEKVYGHNILENLIKIE